MYVSPIASLVPWLMTRIITNCIVVSRIALVSPERSRQIESVLVRMAQGGQLRGRVSESQLIDLLEQVSHVFCLGRFDILSRVSKMEEAQGKGSSSNKKTTIVVRLMSPTV